jgi:hypothetical protein
MYHVVYETTNLVNGKKYIGKHSTDDLNDAYLGSGNVLLRAVKKYGRENFDRTIIRCFDSEEEAFEYEGKLVNLDVTLDDAYYNIDIGGKGVSREILKRWYSDPKNKEKHLRAVNKPETKMRQSIAQKINQNRPEVREKAHKSLQEWHSKPENKAKIKERFNRPEFKEKISEISIAWFSDPENKQKFIDTNIKAQSTPESKQHKREAQIARYEDPKEREKISKAHKLWHSDPKNREEFIKRQNNPDLLKRKSEIAKAWHKIPGNSEKHRKSMKECHNRPEVIEKLRGRTNNKLVKEQVIKIKKRLANGEKQSVIARDYSVDASTISYINTGKVWGYLDIKEEHN